jgi:5-methylcytosine-specific restriction endonuclease McrA
MEILKIIKYIINAKHQHFISVTKEDWKRWSLLIRFFVWRNPHYKSCVIYRKKYKHLKNFVVIGLKWNGKNVKRRTTGFAKEFINNHRNSTCIYCETKLNSENATTDHIIPISEGGNNSQINLMVCCFDCNNERGNTEFVEYLRQKNPKYKVTKIPFV